MPDVAQPDSGICELSKLKSVYDKLLRQNKSGNVRGIAQVHQDIAEQNSAGERFCAGIRSFGKFAGFR